VPAAVLAQGAVVVIGASAGGVEALSTVASGLPADLAAPVLVVLHVSPGGTSVLPHILARAGTLPAAHAADGEELQPGRIYVAPPDCHLLTEDGIVRLSRGPRRNGHRPAIDALFEAAADVHGPRVIGVLLSGVLDDGSLGLLRIKACGGRTVVQDPADAAYPAMPLHAIERGAADTVLPLAAIAAEIDRLARAPQPRGPGRMRPVQKDNPHERPGEESPPSPFTCPECGGSLWDKGQEGEKAYICRVGHSFTEYTLLAEQAERVENSIWAAMRALEERASMSRRLAHTLRGRGNEYSAKRLEVRAAEAEAHEARLRAVVESLGHEPVDDDVLAEGGEAA
jgi:two-component system chemotaxis response regulator CheB